MSNAIPVRSLSTRVRNTAIVAPAVPRLHDKRSIGIAAFLGSPLAGGILFAHNLIRLSRITDAITAILASILVTALMVAAGLAAPGLSHMGPLLPLAAAMAMQKVACKVFQHEYAAYDSGSARPVSVWIGVLAGFLVATPVVILILMGL
jgi:hypothetical protein